MEHLLLNSIMHFTLLPKNYWSFSETQMLLIGLDKSPAYGGQHSAVSSLKSVKGDNFL